MLTSFWNGAGMPFVGAAHASDTNYIFNGVFPQESLISENENLSELMSKSLINFAYTGNPNLEPDSHEHASEWPSAFLKSKVNFDLSEIIVQVFGGLYGAGSVTVHGNGTKIQLKRLKSVLSFCGQEICSRYFLMSSILEQ
jgi:hypothetical protein